MNYKRIVEWEPLIQKVKGRLKSWEHKKISFGGRVTLLNAVLLALQVYHLSIYSIPSKTLSALTSIFCNFLWGTMSWGENVLGLDGI